MKNFINIEKNYEKVLKVKNEEMYKKLAFTAQNYKDFEKKL